VQHVEQHAAQRLGEIIKIKDKQERHHSEHELFLQLVEELSAQYENPNDEIGEALGNLGKKQMARLILEENRRADGRSFTEVRDLSAEAGLLPRTHGSGLFTRGETQVLSTVTLGATRDARLVRTLEEEEYTRFTHHYNFPPFSVGEVRALRGTGRREIGHGHLARRALERMLPPEEDFPYTIRVVSEVLESNGSSSMASVCGATLALMDAGIKIEAPVAGVALGLIYQSEDKYAILTDIQGLEDHAGHMDFKVAGTRQGINALQLDMKVPGLSPKTLQEALHQAQEARRQILDVMAEALPYPREQLSPYAPRMFSLKINPEKIGLLIGPGGKQIRKLQEQYEVKIDVEDDGTVLIFGENGELAENCRTSIHDLTREVEVGEIFTGKVVSTTAFGAFVEIMPGRDGLVHISELAHRRVEKTEDVCKVGDEMRVKVIEVDSEGKVRLSRKALEPREDSVRSGDSGGSRKGHDRRSGRSTGGGPDRAPGSSDNPPPRGSPDNRGQAYFRDKP